MSWARSGERIAKKRGRAIGSDITIYYMSPLSRWGGREDSRQVDRTFLFHLPLLVGWFHYSTTLATFVMSSSLYCIAIPVVWGREVYSVVFRDQSR